LVKLAVDNLGAVHRTDQQAATTPSEMASRANHSPARPVVRNEIRRGRFGSLRADFSGDSTAVMIGVTSGGL
jgi:hypothetical protein